MFTWGGERGEKNQRRRREGSEMAGGASRLRTAAKRLRLPCASFSKEMCARDLRRKNISISGGCSSKPSNVEHGLEASEEAERNLVKILCTICLEPLNSGGTGGQAIFTAQCMHSFHFVCISSNVRHGNVTCPICRAYWTQIPRDLKPFRLHTTQQTTDPILRILDDSIANFRTHRRSSLRSSRYDDDDPVETDMASGSSRLKLALMHIPTTTTEILSDHPSCMHRTTSQQLQVIGPSSLVSQCTSLAPHGQARLCLSVKLLPQRATDIVLVASPNGPHLRLLKQAMALVVFSLRPVDRLAIVTYSSGATRAFPLRRMTSNGKRTALQVIDRLFYLGEANPIEGLEKGVKILKDRNHHNPVCGILHLSDSPTRAYISGDLEMQVPIHRFHIGFGFGASNGFVMHEFEDFLLRLLGGVIRDAQLRICEEGTLIRLGEFRCGEERRISLGPTGECGFVSVEYSYIEGVVEECLKVGELVVGIEEKDEIRENGHEMGRLELSTSERNNNAQRWDYLDPFMARRWAKHLHGYRV